MTKKFSVASWHNLWHKSLVKIFELSWDRVSQTLEFGCFSIKTLIFLTAELYLTVGGKECIELFSTKKFDLNEYKPAVNYVNNEKTINERYWARDSENLIMIPILLLLLRKVLGAVLWYSYATIVIPICLQQAK